MNKWLHTAASQGNSRRSAVIQTIAQDTSLTYDEAAQMIADARRAALTMFPGKDLAYDLIWRPRFQRLMRERFLVM